MPPKTPSKKAKKTYRTEYAGRSGKTEQFRPCLRCPALTQMPGLCEWYLDLFERVSRRVYSGRSAEEVSPIELAAPNRREPG